MIRIFVLNIICVLLFSTISFAQKPETSRDKWLYYMDKVARPVMSNIAADKLKVQMPVVLSETCDNPEQRKKAALPGSICPHHLRHRTLVERRRRLS